MSITQSDLACMLLDEDSEPKALPLSLLKEITNGFSDELEIGRGGYSIVYKGMLENGSVVAVKKRLSSSYMYDKQFSGEVECLMKVKHKNIVRFLGYCADTQANIEVYNGELVMADIQERLLCFEYLPRGSLDNCIKDSFGGQEWTNRYKIIKGICDGLNYLHQKNILHLDLKPANILLDEDMMPKINDFGLSRCFEEDQTWVIATNVGGTIGYLAPEFTSRVITYKFDLYSLGVIITEILTGQRGYQDVEKVLESWSNRSDIMQWEQIRVCAQIGIECTEFNPAKRPGSVKDIIDRLLETKTTAVIPAGGSSELLVLHHFVLCFPFEPNKVITCPLQLTNNTDEHVAFRLMHKSGESFLRLPMSGIVPPRSPYNLVVTTKEHEEIPRKSNMDLILYSTTVLEDDYIETFQSQSDCFFQIAKAMGNVVQEVTLKAFYTLRRQREMTDSSKMGSKPHHMSFEHTGSKPHHLLLQHLKDITGNFSDERILGRGSFGVVYKVRLKNICVPLSNIYVTIPNIKILLRDFKQGVLQSGKMVAVKKLVQAMPSSQEQFENEVNLLMKLDHPNIVRLVGYCYERQHSHAPDERKIDFSWNTECFLCLECMPNGSLDKYISDATSGLDWRTRWKIIEGISFGLQYLHEQPNDPVMHLDLKPANILLDENMVPKIADFGLSRIFDQNHDISIITSGTLGYMPPEYLRGIVTPMSDIFSLGVIILEVITGHRDYPYDTATSSEGFIEHELEKWRNVLQKEPEYTTLEIYCQQIKRCIELGLMCVNLERTERPTIKKIIDMLRGLESTTFTLPTR